MSKGPLCIQGSVAVTPDTTTESPFTLDHGCVKYKDGHSLLNFDRTIVSAHDQIEIVKGLNEAYRMGYFDGKTAPKFSIIS